MNNCFPLKGKRQYVLLLALLLCTAMTAKAQTYYVFYNNPNGYIYNNGGTPAVSTTFTKSSIWVASGTLGNTGRNIFSYTDTLYMRGGTNGTALTLGTSTTTWRLKSGALNYNNNNSGYVHYNGTSLVCSNGNTRFTPYSFNIVTKAVVNPTISITSAAGLSGGGIQLSCNITGKYTPSYDSVYIRNYNANSYTNYYWTATTDAATTPPASITDWSGATKTWAVTTGGTYASVSSDGLVTITGNPTGNIVVTLTVTKGGYTGTQTFTLTRAAISQNVTTATAIAGPTISPSSAALYYNDGSQTFTASATATTTTTTISAHTTLTGGGNTYYYYNGTLYTNTAGFTNTAETNPAVTLNWALSGDAASYLTRTPASGTSTTVTHSSQSPSDLTATLTVTASATGASSKTATATITAYGPMVAPTITRMGNSISLATTSSNATIYYTTDGSTPTASSTPYTGTFALTVSPTTVKAITIRDGHNSAVTTETFNIKLPTPVITISNTGSATIALGEGSPAGTTIHYTTDGTVPTGSSATYSSAVQLTNPQIIKAIAVLTNYDNSDVASGDYITQGVVNGMVILDDREDHSWSYYSDASLPEQLHSLSPADVKITYYGDGIMMTNDADYDENTSSSDYITNSSSDYVGGAKVNVGGEDENTFIYYKTLERGDATDAAWTFSSSDQSSAASRCPYKPIPNPFQVRPTYGSTWDGENTATWTGWRGFQCWRLKSVSGGAVYSAASGGSPLAIGAVINAEDEIYFAPSAEYGMEVELEAVWAIAYVVKANGSGANAIQQQNVGYERNFIVLHSTSSNFNFGQTNNDGNNTKRITNINYSATVSTYYPDGTPGANAGSTIRGAGGGNLTLEADTKFENIPFNIGNSYALTVANHDLIIGRGCSGTINSLQGINDNVGTAQNPSGLDYTMRIESGTISAFSFVRSSGCTVYGRYLVKAIMGCDYDRAQGASGNNNLSVSPQSTLFYSTSVQYATNTNKDQKTFDCVFKSGSYQSSYWTEAAQNGNPESESTIQGAYQKLAYLGQNSAGTTYPGVRCVTVEGGEFSGMCGGRGVGDNSNNSNYMTPEVVTFDLRIKGGLFHGAVYGGAADNPSIGSRRILVTGGEIRSWIAGGCNGTGSRSGQGNTNGDSYIYVGGTALVGGDNAMCINKTNGGQVFGAGRGYIDNGTHRLSSVNNSHVAIADEAVISNNNNNGTYAAGGNVYGGSYNGIVAEESNVYILGGTVEGGVFGGSYGNTNVYQNTVFPAANVTMTGGFVADGVYGGSNSTGTVNNVTMHIDGGQVGTSSVNANVHGGGLGQSTVVAQNVDLTVGTQGQTKPGVTVYGDVYGGSALGSVNGTSANTTYHTNVTLNAGTINGSLYGGALGDLESLGTGHTTVAANVYAPVTVTVNGGTVNTTTANGSGAVYGCNNINGTPQRAVAVVINGTDPAPSSSTYALDGVYGGGNKANYSFGTPTVTVNNCDNSIAAVYGGGNAASVPNTDVTIYGGNKIGDVFAGGNGTNGAANVTGNTLVKVYGGIIGRVFGGSNSAGTIGGSITVHVESNNGCDMQIEEVYGGGNMAASNAGKVEVVCTGEGLIDYVYGGANQADVTGDITLDITGGRIEHVFGGNNTSGTVSGKITVNVDWDETECTNNYLGYVYGAGNQATYAAPGGTPNFPEVNIKNGTVTYDVFGAGYGNLADATKGVVTGNPQVNVGLFNNTTKRAIVGRNVFGGGSSAAVTGNPQVFIKNRAKVHGNVYGGGNQGAVTGNTKVIVNGATTIE